MSREARLCPFCGSPKVYYNERYQSWRCGSCEKSFRTPNYGLEKSRGHGDINKFPHSRTREFRFRRRYFSGQVLLLLLLVLVAIGIMAYTYYHIKELDKPVVIGIMVAAAVVALWDATKLNMLSKYVARRLECGTIVTSFILIALIGCSAAAYTNVSPLYEAKNSVVEWVHRVGSSKGGEGLSANPTSTSGSTANLNTPKGINPRTGTYGNYYLGLVKEPTGVEVDSYGNFIVLINSKDAQNPTYSQLLSFLQTDKTDQYPYRYVSTIASSYYGSAESHVDLESIKEIIDGTRQPNPPRICADFAERLHNDAEIAGIRCAYVSVDLSGYTDPYHYGIPSNTGHALDAFQTTDRGLVYVDDTNSPGPTRSVTTVNVQVGQKYIPQSLFPESGWSSTYDSMGTVTNILMTWDGNWND